MNALCSATNVSCTHLIPFLFCVFHLFEFNFHILIHPSREHPLYKYKHINAYTKHNHCVFHASGYKLTHRLHNIQLFICVSFSALGMIFAFAFVKCAIDHCSKQKIVIINKHLSTILNKNVIQLSYLFQIIFTKKFASFLNFCTWFWCLNICSYWSEKLFKKNFTLTATLCTHTYFSDQKENCELWSGTGLIRFMCEFGRANAVFPCCLWQSRWQTVRIKSDSRFSCWKKCMQQRVPYTIIHDYHNIQSPQAFHNILSSWNFSLWANRRTCERVYVCASMGVCHLYLHGSFEFSTLELCCCLLFWFVLWLCVPLLMNTGDKEKHSTQLIIAPSFICLANVSNIHHSTSLFKVTPNDTSTLSPVCMCAV